MKKISLWIYPIILSFITFILWLPTATLPYWWDSAGFVVQASRQFVSTNFWPLVPDFSNFAHPPLFIALLALFWKLFGESLLTSHLLNLFFTFLLLFFIYFTGKSLIKKLSLNAQVGFLASLFILFTPVVLAQVGIIYLEIPVTALAVMSYYFFINKQHLAYAIAATLMVLTKEIAITIACVYLAITVIETIKKRQSFKIILKKGIYYSLPVGILFLWLIYHHIIKGWWIYEPGIIFIQTDLPHSFITLKFIFIDQFRFLLLLLLLPSIFIILKTKKYHDYLKLCTRETMPLFLIPLATLPFLVGTVFLTRYSILILPFLYLFYLYNFVNLLYLLQLKRKNIILWTVGIIILFAFFSQWNISRTFQNIISAPVEDNLEYINIIHVGQQSAYYIEKSYPNTVIYTSFPMNYVLSWPYEHYTNKSVKTIECSKYKKGDNVKIILLHHYSPGEVQCYKLAITNHFVILKRFEENGKFIDIAGEK